MAFPFGNSGGSRKTPRLSLPPLRRVLSTLYTRVVGPVLNGSSDQKIREQAIQSFLNQYREPILDTMLWWLDRKGNPPGFDAEVMTDHFLDKFTSPGKETPGFERGRPFRVYVNRVLCNFLIDQHRRIVGRGRRDSECGIAVQRGRRPRELRFEEFEFRDSVAAGLSIDDHLDDATVESARSAGMSLEEVKGLIDHMKEEALRHQQRQCLEILRQEYRSKGQEEQFDLMVHYLCRDQSDKAADEVFSSRAGTSPGAFRVRACRLASRLKKMFNDAQRNTFD